MILRRLGLNCNIMGDTCILYKGASFSGCSKTLSVALLTLAVGANGAIFSGEQSAMLGRCIYIHTYTWWSYLLWYVACLVNTVKCMYSEHCTPNRIRFKQEYYYKTRRILVSRTLFLFDYNSIVVSCLLILLLPF